MTRLTPSPMEASTRRMSRTSRVMPLGSRDAAFPMRHGLVQRDVAFHDAGAHGNRGYGGCKPRFVAQ